MRIRNMASTAIVAGFLAPTAALADGLFSNGSFTIGAGAFYSSAIYKGEKSKTTAFPYLAYDSDRLHVGFDGVAYKFINNDNLEFSVRAAPGEKPDFPKNTPLFAGLNRSTAIEAGFDLTYKFDVFYVSGGAMVDVSSKHKGHQAHLKLGADVALGSVDINFGSGVRMRDSKLNNFLYGVSTAEANATRAAYSVGDTIEPFVDFSVSYAVSDRVALVGTAEYNFVDKKVKNSPLTTNKDRYGLGLGLVYSF